MSSWPNLPPLLAIKIFNLSMNNLEQKSCHITSRNGKKLWPKVVITPASLPQWNHQALLPPRHHWVLLLSADIIKYLFTKKLDRLNNKSKSTSWHLYHPQNQTLLLLLTYLILCQQLLCMYFFLRIHAIVSIRTPRHFLARNYDGSCWSANQKGVVQTDQTRATETAAILILQEDRYLDFGHERLRYNLFLNPAQMKKRWW